MMKKKLILFQEKSKVYRDPDERSVTIIEPRDVYLKKLFRTKKSTKTLWYNMNVIYIFNMSEMIIYI